jgi:hypothetical protein
VTLRLFLPPLINLYGIKKIYASSTILLSLFHMWAKLATILVTIKMLFNGLSIVMQEHSKIQTSENVSFKGSLEIDPTVALTFTER